MRELENVIERAAVLCETGLIGPEDLPGLKSGAAGVRSDSCSTVPHGLAEAVDAYLAGELDTAPGVGSIWSDTMEVVESRLLKRALGEAGGVQLRAAEWLGIHRNTMRKKLGSA